MNMQESIKPKSDQLNADDLIAGAMTITIRDIKGTSDPNQPVSIYFENDNNKPFKPCKSMSRLMVAIWGVDGKQYIGKSLTLYRNEKVAFGGMEVGGIRISHASHIEKDTTVILTVSKTKRVPYIVKVLVVNTLPVLDEKNANFEAMKKAIKDKSRTIEQLKAKFIISEEIIKLLNS